MLFDGIPSVFVRAGVWLAGRWPWLGAKVNAYAIDKTVRVCRNRPHPWSTVHDYVSWTSLTDLRYSARHLPAVDIPNLPSPERVREVFRRPDGKQRLCQKSTLLFPAFAQYLTDGFIRTRMPDQHKGETDDVRRQNTSNHQIDLCPLYGRTPAQTTALRAANPEQSGKGRLESQIIQGEEYPPALFDADGNLVERYIALDPPLGLNPETPIEVKRHLFAVGGDRANATPQVAMINTLLLREHNRLAGELSRRNPSWNDERVFETARSIVIVLFIKLVVEEYINHIAPSPIRLMADPTCAYTAAWNRPNWITTEFSLLYRWHSLLPEEVAWGGVKYNVGATRMNNKLLTDIGLARAFAEQSSQKAGQLGSRNTADRLVDIEMSAVNQGRVCRVAPYADYCEYVSMPRPKSFADITSDPDVASLLKDLYGDPGRVEFYVGLFADRPVKNSPLPPMILRMVAVDAFSQALTNPLLSEHVFKPSTFTDYGWGEIQRTHTLRDLLERNSPKPLSDAPITMTQPGWSYSW